MSNRVVIQPTRFINYDLDGNVIEETYGYRVFDDYASDYWNWDNLKQFKTSLKKLKKLKNVAALLLERHTEFYQTLIDGCASGIYVGNDYYQVEDFVKVVGGNNEKT